MRTDVYTQIKNKIANAATQDRNQFENFTNALSAILNKTEYDESSIIETKLIIRKLTREQKRYLLKQCKMEMEKWK